MTGTDRDTIRELFADGWSQKAIAQFFDVSRPTITRLINGTIWDCDIRSRTFQGVADACADQWTNPATQEKAQ